MPPAEKACVTFFPGSVPKWSRSFCNFLSWWCTLVQQKLASQPVISVKDRRNRGTGYRQLVIGHLLQCNEL